jgi:hypothetical protein
LKQGSSLITKTLKAIVETGRPAFGVRMLYKFMGWAERFSPKRCKMEHWPLGDRKRVNKAG